MDLIAKLEQATEGSRHFDYLIHAALGWQDLDDGGWVRGNERMGCNWPHYTTSLDAALSLVPSGHDWLHKSFNTMTVVRLLTPEEDTAKKWAVHYDRDGATPALALCMACLKARHQTHGNHPGQDDQKEVTDHG
jgi:hypothetical protein